uniref:Flap endonuclease 1-A-like n=1 Tax=Dermatophagoides pteronyssinus TaxID=6956 RepID=A0A6P6Y7G4_DERPT|nr:flap endonuclease 1-A-like [Dermatophagoides pteronyssinus]
MGVKGLSKLVKAKAPAGVKHVTAASFCDRRVAIDAATSLYAFLTAIRDTASAETLSSADGKVTSHISGCLSRVIKILGCGVKPIFVFDGAPPAEKEEELRRRSKLKAAASEKFEAAKAEGDRDAMRKFASQSVNVTEEHIADIKRLLELCGLPYVQAKGEAEAECANLFKRGLCDAVASEDSDTLCYGVTQLCRSLDYKGKEVTMQLYLLDEIEAALRLSHEQFVELCLLCGCDYISNPKRVGPLSALKLMQQFGSIEECAKQKPELQLDVAKYAKLKNLFLQSDVLTEEELQRQPIRFAEVKEAELKSYLVDECTFNADRASKLVAELVKSRASSKQRTLAGFTVKRCKLG